jgi:hypothetical protein
MEIRCEVRRPDGLWVAEVAEELGDLVRLSRLRDASGLVDPHRSVFLVPVALLRASLALHSELET